MKKPKCPTCGLKLESEVTLVGKFNECECGRVVEYVEVERCIECGKEHDIVEFTEYFGSYICDSCWFRINRQDVEEWAR